MVILYLRTRLYSKLCKTATLKKTKIVFQDQLSLSAGQMYCKMLPFKSKVLHSAILFTFIKLPFVIKIFALSIFEWPFYTYFIVQLSLIEVIFVCDISCTDNFDL